MFGRLTNFEGSLLDEFRRMEREIEDVYGHWPWPAGIRSVARGTFPPINVGLTSDEVNLYVFAAGLDPEALDITIQQNLLTVSGERKVPVKENADYYRRERYAGEFRRVITLPDDVDSERVTARYSDGIVHITVQRREEVKPRQIPVN